jgi:peptide/nickel transport system substrate-binding protein
MVFSAAAIIVPSKNLTHDSKRAIVLSKNKIKVNRKFSLLLLAVLAGCFRSSELERPAGGLVIAIESNPAQLDPRYASDANSVRVSKLIFSSLIRSDGQSPPQPELAERWETPNDLTYIFHLRKGVVFQDGRPLTAADVKFTYDCVLDPSNASPHRDTFRPLDAVEVIGPHTVKFRLKTSHAAFLESADLGIVPDKRGLPCHDENLIGAGPFLLEGSSPGERVTLRANPLYWKGRPAVDTVMIRVIPDAVVRVLEFKKGAIDFLQNDIEPEMLPWLRENTDARILTIQGTTFQYIGMNLEHPVLKRLEVRQALAHAIDQQRLVRYLMKGLADPATGLLTPSHWAYEPDVVRWPYRPEEAKRLLDQAGFPDPDGAGPLPRFKLSYKATTMERSRRMAEALQEQLREVGVELEIRIYEWGTFYSDVKKGNFHLYSLSWIGARDPDIYFNLFHSASVPPHGNNRGRYLNPELDRLLERGRTTLDLRERRRIYGRVQKILAADLPYIPVWWLKNVVVTRPELRGFVSYPDGDLASLQDVELTASALP